MQPEIALLTVRQLLSRRRLLILAGIAVLPSFVAILFAASNPAGSNHVAPDRFLGSLCDGLVLTTVLPIVSLVFGVAALGNEIEDGTMTYLLLKPVARWRIVIAKLVPSVLIVVLVCVLSVLAATLISGRDTATLRAGFAFVVGVAAGGLVYTTVFLCLSLFTSHALIIGFIYALFWEGAMTALFKGLRMLSVREYARTVAAALAHLPPSVLTVSTPLRTALIAIAIVTVAGVLIAARRLDLLDIDLH